MSSKRSMALIMLTVGMTLETGMVRIFSTMGTRQWPLVYQNPIAPAN
jgi:hypothetical protein